MISTFTFLVSTTGENKALVGKNRLCNVTFGNFSDVQMCNKTGLAAFGLFKSFQNIIIALISEVEQ